MIIVLKGFIKQPVIKQRSFFLNLSFLADCCMSVFSFFIKAFVNFEKLIRFYRQAFIAYKNKENLKILLIEIFRQKLIDSNVILVFLDHLKPKIFFVGQPWWPTYSAPLFQNL